MRVVVEDSRVEVFEGDTLLSFRGEVWTFKGIAQGPNARSEGKIDAVRPCKHGEDHPFWCRGQEWGEYYPSVFGLKIIED